MRYVICGLLLVSIPTYVTVLGVHGQVRSSKGVPITANVLSSIVYQAHNPLKIEEVLSVMENKRLNTYYTVRNTGTKPIKYYRIAHWFSDNTGYVIGGAMPLRNRLDGNETFSVIPDELRKFVASSDIAKLKMLGFSMVVEVGFMDGTTLSFENDLRLLETHLEKFESVYDRNR